MSGGRVGWLATHPNATTSLAARVDALVGDRDTDATIVGQRCAAAAETLLARLLADGCTTRESALDLLVADALVTYAFEAAADEPDTLAAQADRAMARIAALGVARAAAPESDREAAGSASPSGITRG